MENNKNVQRKRFGNRKIISCNVCDADGKIIGKTTRPLDDEPICHDYKSNNNIIKTIDKN